MTLRTGFVSLFPFCILIRATWTITLDLNVPDEFKNKYPVYAIYLGALAFIKQQCVTNLYVQLLNSWVSYYLAVLVLLNPLAQSRLVI